MYRLVPDLFKGIGIYGWIAKAAVEYHPVSIHDNEQVCKSPERFTDLLFDIQKQIQSILSKETKTGGPGAR